MGHPDTIKPGTILSDCYRVIEQVGEGGWAYVYKAEHIELPMLVAVKQLKPELVERKKALARFLREATIVSQLNHPNVVTIYNIGHDDEAGWHYIITEFAEKGALSARVKDYHSGLPVDEVLRIAMGICSGLDVVHQKGVVHLDIKPSNVLLCNIGGQDVPKLSDFGIAKTDETEGTDTFKSYGPQGSYHYASPEQLQLDEIEVDRRSDIYSLGVLIYELLTGRVPFTGKYDSVSLAHMLESPTPPSELKLDIPPRVEQIVLRALRKRREDRYQSAADMHEALKAVEDVSIREERRAGCRDFLRQGIEHRQKGEWDAAIETLTKADLLDPGNEIVQRELQSARAQQKLERLYDQGVRCLEKQDWEEMERSLLPVVSYDPGYAEGGARGLLELARRRRDLTVKYHTAMGYFRQKKWAQAVAGLEDVVAKDADFEDAASRLEDARGYRRLFDKAEHHARRGEWDRVVGLYEGIAQLRSSDVDVTEELAQAKRERDEARTKKQLADWYAEGIRYLRAGRLTPAQRAFERIRETRPDYRDAAKRLTQIDKEIKLRPFFERASGCEADCDWEGAIDSYREILDADRHNARATKRLYRATRCAGGGYRETLVSRGVRVRRWWDGREPGTKVALLVLLAIIAFGFCLGTSMFTEIPIPLISTPTPTPTLTATPTATLPEPPPTDTPSPILTPTQSPTPTETPILYVTRVYSVGYQITPDQATFLPGTPFTVSWGLGGASSGHWPEGSKLVFVDGDQMGESGEREITPLPAPGEVVTVQVSLSAPASAGKHTGIWQVQDADGNPLSDELEVIVVVWWPAPTPYPSPSGLAVAGIVGCDVPFSWYWPGTLANDEWFAVRVSEAGGVEPRSVAWTKEFSHIYPLTDAGDYIWEIVVCRGDPSKRDCNELVVSERGQFNFRGCDGGGGGGSGPDRP